MMFEQLRFYLSHSFNDLQVNKRLTFFAMLSVAAGVAAIVSLQTLAIMIAKSKVQGGGMAQLTKVVALSQILRLGQLRLNVLPRHECVAKGEMKVRLIGQSIAERTKVNVTTRVFIKVRICLHGEDKRTARVPLSVKRVFFATLLPIARLIMQLVEVPYVR